jgi:hypothetical protein
MVLTNHLVIFETTCIIWKKVVAKMKINENLSIGDQKKQTRIKISF